MSSFILQLSIILAFGLMVQSAPVDVTKRSTMSKEEKNKRKLENNLYCASQTLHIEGDVLRDAKFTLPSLPQPDINNATEKIVKGAYRQFSDLCKEYTKAMTLKHQLQEQLFSNDTALKLNSDNAEKLSKILTSLQSMANIFNDMEFYKVKSRCVNLTPAQYKITYHVRYTKSLLVSLKDDFERWYKNERLYEYKDERHC